MKLVSLNVERSKHTELVLPFLQRTQADIVCLMELMDYDIPRVQEVAGQNYLYEPMSIINKPGEKVGTQGIGIFSRLPLTNKEARYYRGSAEKLSTFDSQNKAETNNHMLLVGEIEREGELFKIATTHFPVTPNGQADDIQRRDIQILLKILAGEGGLVFCGDFNAPRGGEIFSLIAQSYKDNVPPSYTTSIDGNLHRAGQLPYMVDGIFSTPDYTVSNVEMVSGVSDHRALIGEISKS